MRKVFIYCIKCPDSGNPRYVGKTTSMKKRIWEHLNGGDKCRTHKSNWIESILRSGRKPIFEILQEVDESEWPNAEKKWILKLKKMGFRLTNQKPGGCGSLRRGPVSEDVKAKLSKIFKGRVFTDEWKRKISNAKKGVSPIYKNGNPRLGKPSPSRRRVDVFNRDLIYYETCDCIKDAAQKYGVDTGAVVRVASGQRNHANGYVFRYAD